VRRRYLIVVPKLLPVAGAAHILDRGAQGRWPRRRNAPAAEEEQSLDVQRSRINIAGFICTEAR
jgi:hypothetical protein